jgi:hypothetical protein
MEGLEVEARLGTALEIDLCPACRTIWFDRYEDLQLSPAATLKLFGIISEGAQAAPAPWGANLRCPRCRSKLIQTHDLQRATRFQYWRCETGHGRLMSFIDFLRAKDFIKPLTPRQIEELRQNVQMINCSNCGGTIDLGNDTVCGHCGSVVSMLDVKQMARTISQLQNAAGGVGAAGATPAREPTDIDALVAAIRERGDGDRPSLIDTGLAMLGKVLGRFRSIP